MNAHTTMYDHAERYIAMKRKLGYLYSENAPILLSFARYAQCRNEAFVQTATVIEWALCASTSNQRVRIFRMVCDLAAWLHAEDARHEVPHQDMLGHRSGGRPTPYLLSMAEIENILAQARCEGPPNSINPLTWYYLFGLLAVTGLRISEALALTFDDLTCDGLIVRDTKFKKSRLVPLHETALAALHCYVAQRCRVDTQNNHLFVLSSTGRPPTRSYATKIFRKLAVKTNARESSSMPGPTTHSLRHSFATRAIEQLSAEDDPGRHMLALSTYLGHKGVSETYWYLESTQVLLGGIAEQMEQSHRHTVEVAND